MAPGTQIERGIWLATLASVLFGATVPFLKTASAGAGTWVSASLLYLGATLGAGTALALRRRGIGRDWFQPRTVLRLLSVAGLGAVCAPALLIAGARRTDAATTSLLLTLEMPFTLLLGRAFFREHFGRRAISAATLLLAGSLLLAGRSRPSGGGLVGGAWWVIAAAAAWALDNTVSRTLADRDPLAVVALKGLVGGSVCEGIAAAAGEPRLVPAAAAALLAIGAVGYGLSLQLYLRAQTLVGSARTASVFAAAPFAGTIVALLTGSPWPGWHFPIAAGLMVAGVALHVSERHRHGHHHAPTTHQHLHSHDDGHHTHVHDPPVAGAHSHAHQHEEVTHEHEHGEDIHHLHRH